MTKEELDRVVRSVGRRYPLTAGLALNDVEMELSTLIDTAAVEAEEVDGELVLKRLLINPDFFDLLSFSEKCFVIAHEALHIAFKHFKRSTLKPLKDADDEFKNINKDGLDENKQQNLKNKILRKYNGIWNIATDACINALLKKDGFFKFPEGIKNPKTNEEMKFVDIELGNTKSAEFIYDELVKKNKDKSGDNQDKNNSENQSENDKALDDLLNNADNYRGIDSHDKWNSGEGKIYNKDSDDSEEDDLSIDETDIMNEETKKREQKQSENAKNIKKSFSSIRNFSFKEKPKYNISWKSILKAYISENYLEKWGKRRANKFNPNYRMEESLIEEIPPVEIILDVSGSISEILLKNFLLEVYKILKSLEEDAFLSGSIDLSIGCFSTEFTGFTKIRNKNDIINYRLLVGGGTDFELAATSFTKSYRKTVKIVFTDGMLGRAQTTRVNDILWVAFGNNIEIKPVGGRLIKVDDKSLSEMESFYVEKPKSKRL